MRQISPSSRLQEAYRPDNHRAQPPSPADYNQRAMQVRSVVTRFERLGLQRRIMLYVAGGLIVVLAAYSAVSMQAVAQSTNLVFRERLMVAGTAARQIDSDLAELQLELNGLGAALSQTEADSQMDQAGIALHGLRQDWTSDGYCSADCSILLADAQGKVIGSDPPVAEPPGADISALPSFQDALHMAKPVVADEFSAEAAGHGSLVLSTPVIVSGQVSGVLLAALDLSNVSQSFALPLQASKAGYTLELLNENGIVLASTNPEQQWTVSDHYSLVKGLLTSGQAGTTTHHMPTGASEPTHIIAFEPLTIAPWGVVVEEPQDVALVLPHALQNQLIVFGAFVLLSGLVLAWVTTRAVVRPVNALIDATQQIAGGDLDHPLDLAAEDEVGRLARSFDEMRLELKQSREEIARWNQELEARVRQRTRELSSLVKSSQALAETLNLDVLFDILIRETREVVPSAEGIVFFLFDRSHELLTARSTSGLDDKECKRLGFRIGEGIAGSVFEAQSPVRLRRLEQVHAAQSNLSTENAACFLRATDGRPVQSALGAPLVSEGAQLGALVLYNFSREDAFTDNEVTVLQAYANQAGAAIQNARLYASLQEKEAARAALLEQAIRVQEEERARVAREIHDELGQLLTRLSIDLKMSESQIVAEPEKAAQTLAATQNIVWQTIEGAHRLIVELRPTLLDELGLEAALREELKTRLEPLGVNTSLEADAALQRLPALVEITVFRVAQEAISNIARHAQAQLVSVSLHAASELQMIIEDDGIGIGADWRTSVNGHRPLGLLGMQERAALVGGTLTVESRVPRGTRVALRVPLDKHLPANPEER